MATLHPKLSEELSQTTVSSTQSIKLKIKRSNPNVNSDEKYDEFVVPVSYTHLTLPTILLV